MRALALTLAPLLLAACGSVPDTYHSLRPEISITPTRQGTPTALRYTELPPYYDSEYLVWYDEHGRITRDKSQHWTYPFSDNLRDVLRQAIAASTPTRSPKITAPKCCLTCKSANSSPTCRTSASSSAPNGR